MFGTIAKSALALGASATAATLAVMVVGDGYSTIRGMTRARKPAEAKKAKKRAKKKAAVARKSRRSPAAKIHRKAA